MIRSRKFKIWLISSGLVLLIFLFYRIFGDFGIIKISRPDYELEHTDVNILSADSNSGRIGQAKLEYVERARFETVDQKTRKLKRVVGFEKVLHKSGDEWVLDKPYMNVYQENMRCDITADTGTVELENLEGANPTPKQAVMKGNVIVHILGQGKRSDSFIYLNEVVFDSDRSMLWSNDKINFISAEAELVGKGLEIVYNNATNRLEFLKIKKVDFLNIQALPEKEDNKEPAKTEPNKTAETAKTVETPAPAVSADKPAEPCGVPQTAAVAEKENDYRCLFRDNVIIEYKNEVILADEIAITNLLRSQKKGKQQQPEPVSQSAAGSEQKKETEITPKSASPSEAAVQKPQVNPVTGKTIIATVKCNGPMIIRPVDAMDYEDIKPTKFREYRQLNSELARKLGQKNLLIAQKVDYDIATETATAKGRVELVFYPRIETDGNPQKIPFIISARQGAQFVIPKKEATFFGNVKGTLVKQTDFYDEENTFYGDKLIANFSGKQTGRDIMASGSISHVTVVGPGVRLESIKTANNVKLIHVRLKSERIDYDRTTEDIIAAGKGKIEYSNTARNFSNPSEQNKLGKPCFSLIEGFTKLVWDTNTMHVQATSENTAGIHIGYLPVLETGYGQNMTIDTKQVDIDYFEPTPGKSQLKKLKATGGIVYYEQGGYEFAGKELNYNALEDYMTVTGSPQMPCMLNGVFVEGIEYNLKTGAASSVLSGGVGIMPVRE